MELLLKKYFWVVHLLVIVIGVTLAAKGVNHVIEGKYLLAEGDHPSAVRRRPPRHVPTLTATAPTKDGQVASTRNIFCSTCEPPKPAEAVATTTGDPNQPIATTLPLALLATSVSR